MSGTGAVVNGVSSIEGAGGKMSSWIVDGGGGVSSNQGGGGIIELPVDTFDSSRDAETCMGGNGTCCGMVTGVSCSVGSTVFLVPGPMVVYHQREEAAWDHHLLRTLAVKTPSVTGTGVIGTSLDVEGNSY